ncbi:hypothetical protein SAY86_001951 [Trapa natans]|uniref:DNA-directed RNA polymerase I subunit rpa49 n=1 Tax=Trapa natans TaxID=22666 RepID=A0AAN7LET1_TRANT|nr:hypothetical protein SAY86_001951 [Trapa natans]
METDRLMDADAGGTSRKKSERSKKRKKEKVTTSIQVLHDQAEKMAPLVGYFPSGFDPTGPPSGVHLYRKKTRPNRMELTVSPSGSDVVFVGSSFDGEPTAIQPCTYALGVLDKESGTLKIVPVASNKIFRLEPRFKHDHTEDERSELKGDLSGADRAEKVRVLTHLYGTKRSITHVKKMQALRQEVDPDSQNDLDKQIKKIAINKEALESTGAEISRNIPAYNSAATDPKEAYPLEKIILDGEWNYITDIIELVSRGEEVSADAYPSFVCKRVSKLLEIKDKYAKDTLGCVLSYITHLLKFKDLHSADGFKSAKSHHFPPILQQRFSALFMLPEAKFMPIEKIDLLISHVLVLCLFVDDFQTSPIDIASDLKMSPVELRKYFENLGCKFSMQKKIPYAKLIVPLKFPELRRRRRRGLG